MIKEGKEGCVSSSAQLGRITADQDWGYCWLVEEPLNSTRLWDGGRRLKTEGSLKQTQAFWQQRPHFGLMACTVLKQACPSSRLPCRPVLTLPQLINIFTELPDWCHLVPTLFNRFLISTIKEIVADFTKHLYPVGFSIVICTCQANTPQQSHRSLHVQCQCLCMCDPTVPKSTSSNCAEAKNVLDFACVRFSCAWAQYGLQIVSAP